MTASIAGDRSYVVADIGWLLFTTGVEYDYIQYDDENDEITIAHPGGLVILGPGEDVDDLLLTDWWHRVF